MLTFFVNAYNQHSVDCDLATVDLNELSGINRYCRLLVKFTGARFHCVM